MYCIRPPSSRLYPCDERCAPKSTRYASMRSRSAARPCLVERLVEVPALRALDARRAPGRARAALQQAGRVLDPVLEAIEPALGDPDAAGVAVVDEDRRAAGLVVEVRREAADVPAIAHRPQRKQRDEAVLGGVERAEELRHLLESVELIGLGREPDRLGLEGRLGHEHRDDVDRRAVAHRLSRVGDDLLGDRDAAEVELDAELLFAR